MRLRDLRARRAAAPADQLTWFEGPQDSRERDPDVSARFAQCAGAQAHHRLGVSGARLNRPRPERVRRLPEQYFGALLARVSAAARVEGEPLIDLGRGNP